FVLMLRALMRRPVVAALRIYALVVPVLLATTASADETDAPDREVPNDLARLILDNGRVDVPRPDADAYRFFLH
ncbi:hypothetical protein G6O45_23485, partial [Salmonella enterica subsp. enterica serovar Istanbul]|nr:hypothetical protein [Salmonella enterica subsp. enterica serovar Istanbul]